MTGARLEYAVFSRGLVLIQDVVYTFCITLSRAASLPSIAHRCTAMFGGWVVVCALLVACIVFCWQFLLQFSMGVSCSPLV